MRNPTRQIWKNWCLECWSLCTIKLAWLHVIQIIFLHLIWYHFWGLFPSHINVSRFPYEIIKSFNFSMYLWLNSVVFSRTIFSCKLQNVWFSRSLDFFLPVKTYLIYYWIDFVVYLNKCNGGRFDWTGPLAYLSLFSVMLWIRSNYLFRSEARFFQSLSQELNFPIKVFHMS